MGFLDGFSSLPKADSGSVKKRDSKAEPGVPKSGFV
jgi:hypothetical protein